jgi:hypothetical protein
MKDWQILKRKAAHGLKEALGVTTVTTILRARSLDESMMWLRELNHANAEKQKHHLNWYKRSAFRKLSFIRG